MRRLKPDPLNLSVHTVVGSKHMLPCFVSQHMVTERVIMSGSGEEPDIFYFIGNFVL